MQKQNVKHKNLHESKISKGYFKRANNCAYCSKLTNIIVYKFIVPDWINFAADQLSHHFLLLNVCLLLVKRSVKQGTEIPLKLAPVLFRSPGFLWLSRSHCAPRQQAEKKFKSSSPQMTAINKRPCTFTGAAAVLSLLTATVVFTLKTMEGVSAIAR